VKAEPKLVGNDHEIIVNFTHTDHKIHLVKTNIPIPPCIQFRYFEVDVLENKVDAKVFVGLVEEKDPFPNTVEQIEMLNGR
jgi:hypothetical protein